LFLFVGGFGEKGVTGKLADLCEGIFQVALMIYCCQFQMRKQPSRK